jgi:hypothetical protein
MLDIYFVSFKQILLCLGLGLYKVNLSLVMELSPKHVYLF